MSFVNWFPRYVSQIDASVNIFQYTDFNSSAKASHGSFWLLLLLLKYFQTYSLFVFYVYHSSETNEQKPPSSLGANM